MQLSPRLASILGSMAVGAMALIAAPRSEAAVLISGPYPQAATVDLGGTIGGADLSASAALTITSFTASTLVVQIALTNTTAAAEPGTNRLVSFGFNLTPSSNRVITGVSSSSADWGSTANAGITGGTRVDICAWDGNNCPGGSNQGLREGESDTFTLTIAGIFSMPLSIDGFVARYQSIGTTRTSGIIREAPPSPIPVPEPMSLALFGVALAGLGASMRRGAKRAA